MTTSDDLEKEGSERLVLFRKFVEDKASQGKLAGKEIMAEAERLDVKDKVDEAIQLWLPCKLTL